jgi:FkbM family methyltransferase
MTLRHIPQSRAVSTSASWLFILICVCLLNAWLLTDLWSSRLMSKKKIIVIEQGRLELQHSSLNFTSSSNSRQSVSRGAVTNLSFVYQPTWKQDLLYAPMHNPKPEYEFISKLTLYGDQCYHFKQKRQMCEVAKDGLEQLVRDETHDQLLMATADCSTRHPGMPCKFFSQQAEDAVVYNMYFSNKKQGVYLEFGAVDGVLYSNTLFLEQSLGWSGVLLEASPTSYKELQKNRAHNKLFNLAICNETGLKTFRGTDAEGGIDESLPERSKRASGNTYSVQCDTLQSVLRSASVTTIDFWSLDVEGGEWDVLTSMDWSIPVHILLVERNANDAQIEQLLVSKGFVYIRQLRGRQLVLEVHTSCTWLQIAGV